MGAGYPAAHRGGCAPWRKVKVDVGRATGPQRPRLDTNAYFTTAIFHRPEELGAEIIDAEFNQEGVYAVEGPGQLATDLDRRMSGPAKRMQLLDVIRAVEHEPTLLGLSSHFVVVAR